MGLTLNPLFQNLRKEEVAVQSSDRVIQTGPKLSLAWSRLDHNRLDSNKID